MAHGMFRSDNMEGTHDGKFLVSLRVSANIDNGNVVKFGGYETGSREVRSYTTPAANDAVGAIAIIGTPEVLASKKYNTVADFYNEAGGIARGYILQPHDTFSVTIDAISKADGVTITKDSTIFELQAGTKLKAVASATSGSTTVGKCTDIQVDGGVTWYTIEVA